MRARAMNVGGVAPVSREAGTKRLFSINWENPMIAFSGGCSSRDSYWPEIATLPGLTFPPPPWQLRYVSTRFPGAASRQCHHETSNGASKLAYLIIAVFEWNLMFEVAVVHTLHHSKVISLSGMITFKITYTDVKVASPMDKNIRATAT